MNLFALSTAALGRIRGKAFFVVGIVSLVASSSLKKHDIYLKTNAPSSKPTPPAATITPPKSPYSP